MGKNNCRYNIITNRKGRKILVMDGMVYIESVDSVKYEDYDATFICYTKGYSVNTSVIWSLLPMLKSKSWLKPTFLDTQFKEHFSNFADVVDGFSDSPLDEDVTNKIEAIEENIAKYGISRVRDQVKRDEDLLINFCRFCLSRGETSFYNNSIKAYGKGYTKMLYSLFGENYFIDTTIRFNQILHDMGYVKEKHFVERLHNCPVCNNTHLIFIECCQSCRSSNISCQPMIHHFRCANISPESTYEFDGDLRCPKCKRFLHHIGVDYDRPASVYTCGTCGNSFANPSMRVLCTSCKRTFTPEDLGTFDFCELEFTEDGIRAIVSDEVKLNMSRDTFVGYSSYESFYRTMKLMIMSASKSHSSAVVVTRLPLPKTGDDDTKQQQDMLIQTLLMRLTDYKISMNNSFIYIMKALPDVDKMYSHTLDNIKKAIGEGVGVNINNSDDEIYGMEIFLYQRGSNTQEFINKVNSKNIQV